MKPELTTEDYVRAARTLDCEVAMIMAFAETEAPNGGFDFKGRLTILFEPHVFWTELQKFGINPVKHLQKSPGHGFFLYKKQGAKPYPGSSDGVYKQLLAAEKIHKEAAFNAASWGKFQILGKNAKSLGYKDVFEMWDFFNNGEKEQLDAFVKFIIVNKIAVHLRTLNYAAAALKYNGKGYKKFKYDEKIAANRLKYLKYNTLK